MKEVKLLLVDDDEMCIMLSKIAVQTTGMAADLKVFNSGEDALSYLENSSAQNWWPDIILLDLNMPVMDGWNFLDRFEQIDQKAHQSALYIVSSTISNFEVDKAKKYESVTAFLSKPLSQECLTNILTRISHN